jgi:hypothetical protein
MDLLKLSYQKFFLIDGIGAVLTASMLAFVLPPFQSYIGMPYPILNILAMAAAAFAAYSLTCFLLVAENWKPYLRGIAIANSSYCIATLLLIIYLWQELTLLGIAYFFGEIILVMSLVRIEWLKTNLG